MNHIYAHLYPIMPVPSTYQLEVNNGTLLIQVQLIFLLLLVT